MEIQNEILDKFFETLSGDKKISEKTTSMLKDIWKVKGHYSRKDISDSIQAGIQDDNKTEGTRD